MILGATALYDFANLILLTHEFFSELHYNHTSALCMLGRRQLSKRYTAYHCADDDHYATVDRQPDSRVSACIDAGVDKHARRYVVCARPLNGHIVSNNRADDRKLICLDACVYGNAANDDVAEPTHFFNDAGVIYVVPNDVVDDAGDE